MMSKISKLGDVCTIISGNSIPAKEKDDLYRNVNEGLFYVATKDISFNGLINYENGVRIPSKHNSKFKISKKDSVLICAEGGSAGKKIAYSERDCHFVNKLFSIKPDKYTDSKYIYYYTLGNEFQSQFKKSMHGLIGGVSLSKIKSFQITYPPILQQRSIVAKLDSAFDEIDKIKKSEETKLKKNETLIQKFLDNIFTSNKNLYKLSDCVEINPAKKEVNDLDDATEVSFMPMKDMGINNKLAIPKQKRKLKDVKGNYTYFSEGDILLAKITPCFENGKMGIASNLLNGIGFGSSEYIVFRPNKNLKNDWLYYFLNRKSFRIDGAQNMSGAVGHKRVNKDFIGNTLIPIPSVEEQEKILLTLKSLSNHSKTINKIILKKKDEMSHLKKSILNKLLSNKLVDAA